MLQVLVDPRAKESSYSYYTGAALEGVPETVARDFWGRLGAVQKGVQQVRRQLWLYQEFSRTRQIVFHRDARKMDFEIAIDVVRLAAVSLRYVRKNRNATTFELQDAPVYDPAAGSASLPLRHLTTTTYHAGTKLVHEFTDLQRSVTKF
jgi:hypothetical protein